MQIARLMLAAALGAVLPLRGWAAPVQTEGSPEMGVEAADGRAGSEARAPVARLGGDAGKPRWSGREAPQEASTGSRNLDLLLEMRRSAGEALEESARAASMPATAGSRPRFPWLAGQGGKDVKPAPAAGRKPATALLENDGGDLSGAKEEAADPQPARRQWSGGPGVAAAATAPDPDFAGRGSGAERHYDTVNGPVLKFIPRSAIRWLQENRDLVLIAGMSLLALIGVFSGLRHRHRQPGGQRRSR